jgi:phytoene dehydrogenase-like protein
MVPEGGMYSIVKGMHTLAEELGVKFIFNEEVNGFGIENRENKQDKYPA